MLYRFVLDEHPLGENDYSERITNIGDAIRSQSTQYFYSNGRFIVHVLVQMFTGVWGIGAYSIFTSILILLTMWIFGCYCLSGVQRLNPLWWFCISITFLYLFQSNSRLWYPIAEGLNYLYPIVLTVLFLLIFRHYESRTKINLSTIVFASLAGFITGWSQECYSLPLSGGVFLLLVTNLIRRKKIPTLCWVLAISLWVGTLILVVAPGNFVRLNGRSGYSAFVNGIVLLLGTRLFWLMVVALTSLLFSGKKRFNTFIRKNYILILTLTIAICFGMIANTRAQSFNGISLYCALILFRMTSVFAPFKNKSAKISAVVSILGFILLSLHQIRIINACMKVEKIHNEFVQNYIASPNGVLERPKIVLARDVKPFVEPWFDSEITWWLWRTLNKYYTHGEKPLWVLDKTDYNAYRGNDISSLKRISNGVYQGSSCLWFEPSYTPMEGDSVIVDFKEKPKSIFSKVRSKVFGNTRPVSSTRTIVVDSTTIIGMDEGLHGIRIGADTVVNLRINKSHIK